jgi:DNA-directed RNA polymerase sigma subunit (sigma70/sigma32)
VLHTLTLREEKIMRMRFGLEDDSEHTLEKVGQPSRSGKLKLFLDNVHE